MDLTPYKALAQRLDSLPSGYPPTEDGAELRLLQKLFTPEEAELGAKLRLTKETPDEIGERTGRDPAEVRLILKGMAKKGLIEAGRVEKGLAYGLMPFVVGIYEYQAGRIDEELAVLFEDYYKKMFENMIAISPSFHRVVPINQSVEMGMEIHPHESIEQVVLASKAWGVVNCICRDQQAFVGNPCDHPRDVCMIMSEVPGSFDNSAGIRALSQDEALATIQRAADAGLVHSLSNSQEGHWYVCNCCTCSCGILRGVKELGKANVIARSPFLATVDAVTCTVCELCLDHCQFGALAIDDSLVVDAIRCVGCGHCIPACPDDALTLVRRPEEEILDIPATHHDWRVARAAARGIDLEEVL